MDLENQLLSKLLDDINNNRISLPTLPEVAIKVREVIEDPNSSAAKVAITIGADPVLSTKLLQVANSVMYRATNPIENLRSAIARLGTSVVRNIVTGIVMKQLYQNKNSRPQTEKQLKTLWLHSTKVAAISHVFARKFTKLKPDQAMLAGLIHDIGSIPIYMEAPSIPELKNDAALLESVVFKLHNLVGTTILDAWNFPQELIDVVANHEDLRYVSDENIDYVDIVTIANILSYLGTQHHLAKMEWTEIPAFKKLGLSPEDSITALEEAQEEVSLIQNMFVSSG